MARRKQQHSATGSGRLDLADEGLPGYPRFDPESLLGATISEKATSYADALSLEPGGEYADVIFRAACLIEDDIRERLGLPPVDEEILDHANGDVDVDEAALREREQAVARAIAYDTLT
ncbi:hypothetical protein GCM10011519_33670 [Marmoricola endophyticus]|uniref:Uncharacterized protein n=1 Tax=Marmoricola endophyticus TaxID=2040280 RepID=A0A917BV19_9ACTN|nr:hypothetical protein [Marmoricola endophyticus]GGF56981.1 hypothetical protein GCM10011519_33670 [Marmoricola endophyticus]